MTPRGYDYFMVHVAIGARRKYRRLSPPERWCAVAGLMALAAVSPTRGALLVAPGVEATVEDMADQAGVTVAVAKSAFAKLRTLGEIVRDDTVGAWVFEDWDEHQPSPRRKPSDSPEATRDRKRRERERKAAESRAAPSRDVTRDGHARSRGGREVEVEEKVPPTPKGEWPHPPTKPANGRKRDHDAFDRELSQYAEWLLPDVPEPHRTQSVSMALGMLTSPTNDQVASWVRKWTADGVTVDSLGAEHRAGIAELGARTVALNESASTA